MLYSCRTPGSVQYSIRAMSRLRATIPSVNRNPAASSKSWPGVTFVPLAKVQGRGVFPGDEDVPAPGAEERIDVFLDHRIELFSAARAQKEASFRDVEVRERHDGEASPAVGRGENPSLAKAGAPVLEGVPLHPQVLDPVVGRYRLRDFGPDRGAVFEVDQVGGLRPDPFSQLHEE